MRGIEFTDGAFRVGDSVRFRLGKEAQGITSGEIGVVSDVETYPIRTGPVPMIRVRFAGRETAWESPGMFEFVSG